MSVRAHPRSPTHRRLGPRKEWVLVEPLTICDSLQCWTIPAGTAWDYASVPRPARLLMETTDLGCVSSAAHDYLYRRCGVVGPHIRYTRAQADKLFLRLMAWEGVPWFRRYPAYYAVRVGGRGAWRDLTPKRKAAA